MIPVVLTTVVPIPATTPSKPDPSPWNTDAVTIPAVIPSELTVAPDPTVTLFVEPFTTILLFPMVAIPVMVMLPAIRI